MKHLLELCEVHWYALKDALDERGLNEHLAGSVEELVEMASKNGTGDPASGAAIDILSKAVKVHGVATFERPEGEPAICPLCWTIKTGMENGCGDDEMLYTVAIEIERAADEQAQQWSPKAKA